MKAEGKGSKSPLRDSFLSYPNNKYVLLALLGATAGQGVVWYTGQFYALFFLTITLKLDYLTAYMLVGDLAAARHAVLHLLRRALGPDRPAQDHPRRLPDRGAHLLPAVQGADALRQPGAGGVPEQPTRSRVAATDCNFHIFVAARHPVHRLRQGEGLPDQVRPVVHVAAGGARARRSMTKIGNTELERLGRGPSTRTRCDASGYPAAADKTQINYLMADPDLWSSW